MSVVGNNIANNLNIPAAKRTSWSQFKTKMWSSRVTTTRRHVVQSPQKQWVKLTFDKIV